MQPTMTLTGRLRELAAARGEALVAELPASFRFSPAPSPEGESPVGQ